MNIFWRTIIIAAASAGATLLMLTAPALAQGAVDNGLDMARGDGVPTNLADGDGSIIRDAINLMLTAVAVISVIMLIYGGFRYIISGGQKEAVTNAKNTILYAIIGLLIAIFAYAIIQFVVNVATGTGGGGTNV